MEHVIEMKGIVKRFGGVVALNEVDLSLKPGEVHFLLGENGAGKSTLIKTLMGILQPDEGEISIDGTPTSIRNPKLARKLGINAVFQELSVTPSLPVWRNIWLGTELTKGKLMSRKYMRDRADQLLQPFEVNFGVDEICENLSIAEQQIVEICKALVTTPRVLILDEATSSLYKEQVDLLLDLLLEIKKQGTSILYITHRLSEAYRIVDRITILRDGKHVISAPASEMSFEDAVYHMSGNESSGGEVNKTSRALLQTKLKITNLSNKKSQNLNFDVKQGEILGIAGLQGHGQEELIYSIYGSESYTGTVELNGRSLTIRHPSQAIENQISMISGDRKEKSIFLPMSLQFNIGVSSWPYRAKLGFLDSRADLSATADVAQRLRVNTKNLALSASSLSGGNQQKLVAARALLMKPEVILLDDPTRGIDIGTKKEFHKLLLELAESGVAIILVSSDSEELVEISDRVLVMRRGQIVSEMARTELTVDKLIGEAFER